MKATDHYFPVVLFTTLYKVLKTKRLSSGLGTSSPSSLSPSNPGPGYFSITLTSIAHGHVNEWVITFLTWRVHGSKKLTYFNNHFRPSPTSLYSESVSFEHLKEIQTLRYKITNFQRSLAGMFSASPHSQEQLFRKNVRKVVRLISKTANSVFFAHFSRTWRDDTMCNSLTQRRSWTLNDAISLSFLTLNAVSTELHALAWLQQKCTRTQKWAPGLSVHTIFVKCGQSTAALFSLLSSCFEME